MQVQMLLNFKTYKAKYIASKYARAYWDTQKEKM